MKTITEAIDSYITHCQVMNYTTSTLQGKQERFRAFTDWCEIRELVEISEISEEVVYSYQKFLFRHRKRNGRPLNVSTQSGYIQIVKILFDWLQIEGHIVRSPAHRIRLPKKPKKIPSRGFSSEELKMIFESCDPNTILGIRNRCLFELMYCTAARRAEIANMRLQHVNHSNRTIFIEQGKGQKDGIVLYGKSSEYWLDRYLKHSRSHFQMATTPDNLFISSRGKAFSPETLGNLVRIELRKIGVHKEGAAHCFRHTFAAHMLERGMDSRYISEFLRHENMETTQRYLSLDVSHLRKQFDEKFESL